MTVSTPRVSVLMAVHNGDRYLSEAIDSILAQSFADFELIVVDDGSSDASPTIVHGYNDPRIVPLRISHSGLVTALNHGFSYAKGGYIARMDADDRAMPDRFALQVEHLDQHLGTAILCSDVYTIDAAGARNGKQIQRGVNNAFLREGLLGHRPMKPVIHPSVMMRRQVLEELGGYRHFTHAEDRDLWLRSIDRFGFARLEHLLLEYRIYGGGISRTKGASQALAGAMSSVCYLVCRETGIDLFDERPDEFLCLRDEMQGRLEREVLGPRANFRNARLEMLNGRKLHGLVQMGRAFIRHGPRVLPACTRRTTASLVSEFASRYANSLALV